MNLDRAVLAFAAAMTLSSLALAHFVAPLGRELTAFIGRNMLRASVTEASSLAHLTAHPLATPSLRNTRAA